MEVPIRRVDKEIPLPQYQTAGAVALDCAIREDTTIPPQGIAYAPLNFSLQPPLGHWVLMAARSSLHKRGLMLANGLGIFDEDFSGDEDEYKVALYNFTNEHVDVKKGERLTQIVFLPYDKVEWNEVETLGKEARGGFGTTGK
jgi:dUTP pyrophosphatase